MTTLCSRYVPVSAISALMVFLLTLMLGVSLPSPMAWTTTLLVRTCLGFVLPCMNLERRLDLPTPESPMTTTVCVHVQLYMCVQGIVCIPSKALLRYNYDV